MQHVLIMGDERAVYLLDSDHQPLYFAVVVDRTLVKGYAHLPAEELMKMLSDLHLVGR